MRRNVESSDRYQNLIQGVFLGALLGIYPTSRFVTKISKKHKS